MLMTSVLVAVPAKPLRTRVRSWELGVFCLRGILRKQSVVRTEPKTWRTSFQSLAVKLVSWEVELRNRVGRTSQAVR